MKAFKIACVTVVCLLLCAFVSIFFYFHLYSRDLPNIRQLSAYDGSSPGELDRLPSGEPAKVNVTSVSQMGHARDAFRATEGDISSEGIYLGEYHAWTQQARVGTGAKFSLQISRSLLRNSDSRFFRRQVAELRLAHQIERHFTPEQIFNIHQNTVYLGDGQYGIEAGSRYYFGVPASQLKLSDAALIAGLIRAPNKLSPYKHPERALERRNQVLDEMQQRGYITPTECQAAKVAPLNLRVQ